MREWMVVVSAALFGATGCAGTADDSSDPSTSEDAVRTSECPAAFTLGLDKPEIFARTPTKFHTGGSLTDSEKQRVGDAMKQARAMKGQSFSFQLDKKANARCQYKTADGEVRADLRGPSSKPLIDIKSARFRFYAFPRNYGVSGFVFDSGARSGVFAQVASSGPFDPPDSIVKIGNATIAGASPPLTGDIGAAIAQLEGEAVLAQGRNDKFKVAGATALEMVKGYINAKYADDDEIRSAFEYKSDQTSFGEADSQVAGTFKKDAAIKAALTTVQLWFESEEGVTPAGTARLGKAKTQLEAIATAGGTFGFSGFAQNGCATPTSLLLVIDPKTSTVYGVDLNPCQE